MIRRLSLAFVLTALPLVAAEPAPKVRQVHWKTELSGAQVPTGLTMETWVKGDRVRSVMNTPVGPSITIIKDGTVYMQAAGMAMKMPLDVQQRMGQARPSDYAANLGELLKDGKKLGKETIDGESCEKWQVVRKSGGREMESILWISPSLKFPRQISAKIDRGDLLMKNHDIEFNNGLDDKLFEPDKEVGYRDLSAMMPAVNGGTPGSPGALRIGDDAAPVPTGGPAIVAQPNGLRGGAQQQQQSQPDSTKPTGN